MTKVEESPGQKNGSIQMKVDSREVKVIEENIREKEYKEEKRGFWWEPAQKLILSCLGMAIISLDIDLSENRYIENHILLSQMYSKNLSI